MNMRISMRARLRKRKTKQKTGSRRRRNPVSQNLPSTYRQPRFLLNLTTRSGSECDGTSTLPRRRNLRLEVRRKRNGSEDGGLPKQLRLLLDYFQSPFRRSN